LLAERCHDGLHSTRGVVMSLLPSMSCTTCGLGWE
jgi:hypothetical protein